MKVSWRDMSLAALLGTIFVFYSYYVFLHAQLADIYGDFVIVTLLFLAAPRLWNRPEQQNKEQFGALFFWAYIGLALASSFFVVSKYVHPNFFLGTAWRLVFMYFVVLAVTCRSVADTYALRATLLVCTVGIACGYILQEYHVVNIHKLLIPIAYLPKNAWLWHDKNFAFWLVAFMWGAISYYWRDVRFGVLISGLIFILCTWAVFLSTSESSQLAIVASGIIFPLSLLPIKKYRYGLYLSGYLSILVFPLVWICVAPVTPLLPSAATKLEAIIVRSTMYDCCAALIKEALFLGYGAGSTTMIRIPPGSIVNWAHNFPGGHPHNLVFLFFLEYGIVGILFILAGLLLLFHYLFQTLEGKKQAPAIWALVAAAWVLFSLSYSIWHADIVMTYAFFLALVVARCSSLADSPPVWPPIMLVRAGIAGLVLVYTVGCGVSHF